MKKWKKWLAAGLAVITLNLSGVSIAVNANPFEPYDRSEAVVLEEGQRKKDSDKKPNPKAWQKINGVCYNGSGVAIPGAITRGIDVSEWQGKINWSKVKKSNVDFAMIRIAYGTGYMDKTYAYNMREANAVGMPVGTYVYSTATTKEQALKEAQLVIEKMRGYKVSYPVVFDLEYSKMGELTPSKISELALTFCNEVKRAGYYPMIYCNTYWYSSKIDMSRLSGLDVWIASYGDKIQAPSSSLYDYTIWQATDGDGGGVLNPTKGLIDGIPKDCNVDVNFGYVDYTKKIIPRTEPVSSYVPGDSGEDSGTGKDGWVEKDGKKYYYKNGEPLKGTRKISGKYYCFDSQDRPFVPESASLFRFYKQNLLCRCKRDPCSKYLGCRQKERNIIWEQMDMHIKAPEMYMENFIFLTASEDMRLQTENESAVREIFTIMVQMAQE